MKNWEKYEDEIKEFGVVTFALRRVCDATECSTISCSECALRLSEELCGRVVANWLYMEYREPQPTLTDKEFAIIEAFATDEYYIVRNSDNILAVHGDKPLRGSHFWSSSTGMLVILDSKLFPFITWESRRTWKIDELKRLRGVAK